MSNADLHWSKNKKITDAEFRGWQKMHSLRNRDSLWVYFSPDNRKALLANHLTGDVLFITNRVTGALLYSNPDAKKQAKHFWGRRIAPRLNINNLI